MPPFKTCLGLVWSACFLVLCGCVTIFNGASDSRQLAIFYTSLFNQRTNPDGLNWSGDWLFRRERLLLIDRFLRDRKPDILILQELMARKGSFSENDFNIVGTDSLSGYHWSKIQVNKYDDTNELEYHAVASGLPVQPVEVPDSLTRTWSLGEGIGRVTLFILELNQKQIPVFNVEAEPGTLADTEIYIKRLEAIIEEVIQRDHYCRKRIIVAGRMPAAYTSSSLNLFLEKMNLKDVSEGFCELPSDCYTASPVNEIYMKTGHGEAAAQMDRIFVHRSAYVQSSTTVLNVPGDDQAFLDQYGLIKVWPTERFGWYTNVRLRQCDKDEFVNPE